MQYRDFFNLYAFYWENALSESEGWNFDILHAIRDSHFFFSAEDYGWITFLDNPIRRWWRRRTGTRDRG
ncbi:MAG: hypothetical protein R2792_11095 [Saprospiraceae bacterium]